MSLSDFLAILEIVITVLIGFVITHMVSVRDSRTRAIKDYYIQELSSIKSEINEFYSNLYKGKLSARDIISWHSAIRNRVDSFDNSVRKTFRIYEGSIAKKLFYNHKYITNSDDFNANYNKAKISFSTSLKINLGVNEKQLYMLIERTLYDINNVRARDYIERKWLEFKSHYLYYRTTEKNTKGIACLKIIGDWCLSHKSVIIGIALIITILYLLFRNADRFIVQEKDESNNQELLQRLDSLNAGVRMIIENKPELPAAVDMPTTYAIRLNEYSNSDTTTVKGWIKVEE